MLKVREDHVRSVLDEARRRLGEITKDPTKYSEILVSLIVQGLFQIMEPKATIRCRQADVGLIEKLLPTALQNYKEKMGKEIAITLDKETFLPESTCGGIELYALNGRLRVNHCFSSTFSSKYSCHCIYDNEFLFSHFNSQQIPNTLEARLGLISEQLVPEIRTALFGRNPSRKFTD